MSHKKHPSKAFLNELRTVFEKHNWSGNAIGIAMSSAAERNMLPPGNDSVAAAGCTPPQTIHYYKYELPNGKVVYKSYCA